MNNTLFHENDGEVGRNRSNLGPLVLNRNKRQGLHDYFPKMWAWDTLEKQKKTNESPDSFSFFLWPVLRAPLQINQSNVSIRPVRCFDFEAILVIPSMHAIRVNRGTGMSGGSRVSLFPPFLSFVLLPTGPKERRLCPRTDGKQALTPPLSIEETNQSQ